jgi:hypothetical protein
LLIFEKVNSSEHHIYILFDLLKQRQHFISHLIMPKLMDHKLFVLNHPYREWFLVKNDQTYVGSVYLTYENHVSISLLPHSYDKFTDILKWITKQFTALPEIKSVRPSGYQMNVPVGDQKMVMMLDKLKYKKIQTTYSLIADNH